MTSLQADFPGTQACINAGNAVSDIIDDLDNTIMLATEGTMETDNQNMIFSDHSDAIMKTAKAFVEETKCFIAGFAMSQEKLAISAQNVVTTLIQLTEVVKYGAASLGSSNHKTQVLLITSLKDVAAALRDIALAITAAHGKSIHDPEMSNIRDSAQAMITKVKSLLKIVRSVEGEHSRGTRDPESTIEATGGEYRVPSGNASKGITCGLAHDLISPHHIILNDNKEMELAREKLAELRKAKYGTRSPDEYQGSSSP